MRPKIILVILLIAAGVVAIAALLSKTSKISPNQTIGIPTITAVTSTNSTLVAPAPTIAVSPALTATNTNTNAVMSREERIQKRADEFMVLASLNDPKAHQKIVDALYDSDRAIRKTALDALEQANDRSVIPDMQKVADQTDDRDDKQAIEDAIEFIKLPSLTEYRNARKAAKAAAGVQSPATQPTNNRPNQSP